MDELPRNHFGLICADPPWRFITYDKTNPKLDPHYSQMNLNDILDLPVASFGTDNCVLCLWATQAQLPDALHVMAAWGFKYKTAGAWAKRSKTGEKWAFGTGFLLRSAAEFFLIGTIGHPRSEVKDVRNLIVAPVREHSRKPDELYNQLERMYPHYNKLELFAREVRPGWTAWGDQIFKFEDETSLDVSDVERTSTE